MPRERCECCGADLTKRAAVMTADDVELCWPCYMAVPIQPKPEPVVANLRDALLRALAPKEER